MFKLAYCGYPHTGGTYTIYRNLRKQLIQHGIELRWVGLAPSGTQLSNEFKHEIYSGEFVNLELKSCKKSTINFVDHIENNYQGVIINVLADFIQTNSVRYIKNHVIKLQIVHSITPATYRAARVVRDYVCATVGPSLRITKDLIHQNNFSCDRVYNIPHAVNLNAFNLVYSTSLKESALKLLYVGRIEEDAKGILWLPEILQLCLKMNINVSLTVAGEGPDLSKLELKINQMGLGQYTNFCGSVSYVDIPKLFADHHVFVMPSRYEGFGFSLIESMASGCVPVCSLISGVTDFIVSHGENGFLFNVGDIKAAAKFISQLNDDNIWQQFSRNARLVSQSRFSIEQQAQSYASLIKSLMQTPPEIAQPLSLDNWQMPSGLKPSFSVHIPNRIKNNLRVWRERLASRT